MKAASMPKTGRIMMRVVPFFILPFIMSFPAVSCSFTFHICYVMTSVCVCDIVILL